MYRGAVAGCRRNRRAPSRRGLQGQILAAGIEDDKRNFTRFFLIRKSRRIVPGANKTSIAFGVKNIPGALFKALSVFALRDISLSKIESRPMRGRPWEYVFYADFLRGDDKTPAALRQLARADLVKVLGIYPRDDECRVRKISASKREGHGRACRNGCRAAEAAPV